MRMALSCPDEIIMSLPASLFQYSSGLGMDFGGSLVKIVHAKEEVEGQVVFRRRTYIRERHTEAFDFLISIACSHLGAGQSLHICGLGSNEFNDTLTRLVSSEIKMNTEFDLHTEAFLFLLRHQRLEDLVYPDDPEQIVLAEGRSRAIARAFKQWASDTRNLQLAPFVQRLTQEGEPVSKDIRPSTARKPEYPFIMFAIGSAVSINLVHENGTYDTADVSYFGGRSIIALGSMLMGIQNFDEMISLLDEANESNIDTDCSDLGMSDADPAYKSLMELDKPLFAFGKGVDRKLSDFDQKDVVRSFVKLLAHFIGVCAFSWATTLKAKQLYFTGGICSTNIFRKFLEAEMLVRNRTNIMDASVDFMFVKNGVHLGAVGGALRSMRWSITGS